MDSKTLLCLVILVLTSLYFGYRSFMAMLEGDARFLDVVFFLLSACAAIVVSAQTGGWFSMH